MRGARLRMGMVRRQNEALTSKLVLGVCAEAEKIWTLAHSEIRRTEMEDAVCFMLIAFGTGLQGMDNFPGSYYLSSPSLGQKTKKISRYST